MNDQILMRIGDRRADLAEELQALGRGQRIRIAIGVDRFALHVLHDEVGQSVVGRAAIDQARDVRMIELRQDLSFIAKPAEDVFGIESSPNELDRDFLAIFVVRSRRQINRAQTAPANFADDLVSAELPANQRLLHIVWKQVARDRASRLLDEAAGLFVRLEEGFYFAAERFIAATFLLEKSRALVRIEVDRRLEQFLDASPAVIRPAASFSPVMISRRSQAFAMRHSRFTVLGETSSTSPISSFVRPPKKRNSTI